MRYNCGKINFYLATKRNDIIDPYKMFEKVKKDLKNNKIDQITLVTWIQMLDLITR